MTQKDKYRVLCNNETSIPVFSRDWWMDAVCGEENWDVLLIENGESIAAAMPYYFNKRLGKMYINQPKLTPKNGMWINYPENQKYSTKLKYEIEIIRKVINKLEELNIARYNQNYNYTFTNWLPFYWNGYKQTTRYTYVIEDLSNLEAIYNNFDHSTKQNVRKAEKIIEVREDLDIEKFYEVCKMTFARQKIKIPYTLEFLKRLDNECMKRNCRKILYGIDDNNKIHSVLYTIWDEDSAYTLLGGGDAEYRNSQAMTLLYWKAIQFAAGVTKKFDFEGSMLEAVEKFFRKYGAIQKPYFNISKDFNSGNLLYVILRDIYDNSRVIKRLFK